MFPAEELRIVLDPLTVGPSDRQTVGSLLLSPPSATVLLVLGHGAGAGMRHPFMERIAQGLAAQGIGTLRYQFPYMEARTGRPDSPAVLTATVRAAVAEAAQRSSLPLFAGGKSLGGRMTSNAQAREPLPGVRGLVFFGFPLHQPGRSGTERAAHLDQVRIPMLFLQGTRDALADLGLIREVCRRLGDRATLQVVEGGDHSFKVLKRSGRTEEEVMEELVGRAAGWMRSRGGP